MGLFDMFKKHAAPEPKPEPEQKSSRPAAVDAQVEPDTLCAPVAGRAIELAQVPDPVFSAGVVGLGCAIWPEEETVYAPLAGTVSVVMGHAVGIQGDDGIEVLVHVGIDTVDMGGDGFTGYVSQGDHVEAGQPVLSMDRDKIAAAGHPDCVVLAVSNTAEFESVQMVATPEAAVAAGVPVVKVVRKA